MISLCLSVCVYRRISLTTQPICLPNSLPQTEVTLEAPRGVADSLNKIRENNNLIPFSLPKSFSLCI